jgi:hypothetical protein
MKEAHLYIREDLHQEDYAVACAFCHHRCRIRPSKRGHSVFFCLRQVSSAELGPLHDAGRGE